MIYDPHTLSSENGGEPVSTMKKPRASVFANKRSGIYHNAKRNNDRCRKSAVKASNRVDFNSTEEATEAGLRPCLHCFSEGV